MFLEQFPQMPKIIDFGFFGFDGSNLQQLNTRHNAESDTFHVTHMYHPHTVPWGKILVLIQLNTSEI